jgi:hypothetical protein
MHLFHSEFLYIPDALGCGWQLAMSTLLRGRTIRVSLTEGPTMFAALGLSQLQYLDWSIDSSVPRSVCVRTLYTDYARDRRESWNAAAPQLYIYIRSRMLRVRTRRTIELVAPTRYMHAAEGRGARAILQIEE